jgi:hypothetical protein
MIKNIFTLYENVIKDNYFVWLIHIISKESFIQTLRSGSKQ